ncbi:MAG: methyltransferase domain-containing protein [Planctomycetes bacterium]|nr:methyltransferase domain-containing protein [Planctomycetota bacterium]
MNPTNYQQFEYVLQLSSAYWKSQVLFTAIELDIFTILDNKSLTAEELAHSIDANVQATEKILNALVSLDLLVKQGKYYQNAQISHHYLIKGKPLYQGDAIHHFHNIAENWTMLLQTVKTGEAVVLKDLPEDVDPHDLKDFITAMHNIASVKAQDICTALHLENPRNMLDLAGGPGTYSIEFVKKYPELHAVVFDLEHVTKLTHGFIQTAGLQERIKAQIGNCLEDDFGNNCYDLILVSNLLHIYNPENNSKILKKCRNALQDEGTIIIHEFVLDETKTQPQFAALFSLNMLIGTQEGASYSGEEYRSWLETSGFKNITKIDLQSDSSLITARK